MCGRSGHLTIIINSLYSVACSVLGRLMSRTESWLCSTRICIFCNPGIKKMPWEDRSPPPPLAARASPTELAAGGGKGRVQGGCPAKNGSDGRPCRPHGRRRENSVGLTLVSQFIYSNVDIFRGKVQARLCINKTINWLGVQERQITKKKKEVADTRCT